MLIMNNKKLQVQWFSTAAVNFEVLLNVHDAKWPFQINLEMVWATKWWLNSVLSFLLSAVTAEDAMLAYKHFCKERS